MLISPRSSDNAPETNTDMNIHHRLNADLPRTLSSSQSSSTLSSSLSSSTTQHQRHARNRSAPAALSSNSSISHDSALRSHLRLTIDSTDEATSSTVSISPRYQSNDIEMAVLSPANSTQPASLPNSAELSSSVASNSTQVCPAISHTSVF
jgi:hypothetical protein